MDKTQNTPDVMEHLARLSRMVRRRPTRDRHLSHGGVRLLGIVLTEDGIRSSELAERLDIRPSSLSEMLGRLEEEGYITRAKDEKDARVTHIHATEKARTEHGGRLAERQAFSQRLRATLTNEEAEAFCATCDKLCAFLEAEYPPEPHGSHGHDGHACPHHGGHGNGHHGHHGGHRP